MVAWLENGQRGEREVKRVGFMGSQDIRFSKYPTPGNMGKFTTMILFLLFLSPFFVSPSIGGDGMTPTQQLTDGQTLVSAGGSFALGFFSPNGTENRYVGIWYNKIPVQTVVWVANRQNPITDSTGALVLTSNGILLITAHNTTVVWSTPVTNMRSPVAQLLDDGNFVVREAGISGGIKAFAWQSFDHPADTLLPGMKLGFDLANGLNRSLTAWTSSINPSPAAYSLMLDFHNDPQMILQYGTTLLWRSGYWNGIEFSAIPVMNTSNAFNFTFGRSDYAAYFMFGTSNNSLISNMVVTPAGTIKWLVWVNATGVWSLFWLAPGKPCDMTDTCGPYGICNANDSPICSCLRGFEPKSPANWALRDVSGGCLRKNPLDCTTDGFLTLSRAKLPGTYGRALDTISLAECGAICLVNCSCTAYATADISGSGCMIWTSELTDLQVLEDGGQDVYVRLATTDLGPTSTPVQTQIERLKHKENTKIAISVGVILGMLLLFSISCIIWWKKKRNRGSKYFNNNWNNDFTNQDDLDLPMLDLNTIMTATSNFSIENKLGQGGFGPVYKGKLGEGQDVAVKRLAKTSIQGIDEFKNEVVLIARLQHRNLVRLLGCCIQREEKILVYEYMPNKSLDSFLFDKTKGALLDWQTRYHIIVGIARGLLYLHQDSRFRIIHRDLKAGNILLDKEMNPKISDFGMARIFGGDESEASTRRVVGTYGYMSPEYIKDGIFSIKSDVFSFGVLMLEIISGKKNRGISFPAPHENLLGYAWNCWRNESALELLDESMDCSSHTAKILKCINVGLLCVQERPQDRPTMSTVVLMLGSDDMLVPHPKKPGFVTATAPSESSSSSKELNTINEVTITAIEGR